jgi:NAD(P)-dependent dehydrogenase (short-subunit alcohol dehydrogenase family)
VQAAKKTVVLTGASRGLGLALARELVRLGHFVEACSRFGQGPRELGFSLQAVDVSDSRQVTRWACELLDRGCVPDILICNAAIINSPAPLWRATGSELHDVISVNVLGTGYTLQAFLPSMIKRKKGLIIIVSSGWGRTSAAEMAPYCASKWAVEGLALSLAHELPSSMAAVTLNPGIVKTDMLSKCWPERTQGYEPPDVWAGRAVDFILRLSARDNGCQLTVPAPIEIAEKD